MLYIMTCWETQKILVYLFLKLFDYICELNFYLHWTEIKHNILNGLWKHTNYNIKHSKIEG